ncbi:MAG: CPBP family intramembrane metalloprotease [Cyclobacteriaceae bacterium]|nr:CPBP family intramembrane metalloprotease [Cyclobacteriaceae bacterium]
MKPAIVSDRHPLLSILFIVIMVGIGFTLIGPGIGLAITSLFYDGDLVSALTGEPDYSIFLPLMVTQGIASFTGLILFPIIYIVLFERKSLTPFFSFREPWIIIIPLVIMIGLGFLVALTPITEWNMHFQFPEFLKGFGEWAREREDALMGLTKVLTDFQSQRDLIIAFVVVALIPGIGEELVFRGLIQNELERGTRNPHLAIWIAAFLFSAIHTQFFGFVPRMLLGALFGYLYHWSGNLFIPMFAHFFHNGFTLFMLYLFKHGLTDLDVDSEEAAPWPWVTTALITTIVLLIYFRKLYTSRNLSL